MKTIAEQFSKFYNVKATEGEVGIEIETETLQAQDYPQGFFTNAENPHTMMMYWKLPMKYWIGHKDGSLRNFGVEFVLKEPLSFREVTKALIEFKDTTKDVKFIPAPPSTSVHVHLNFSKKTLIEVGNFLTLWILFENILVEFCGETRRSNLFALPCRVAEGVSEIIVRMFNMIDEGDYRGINIDSNHAKYGAVNVAPLSNFGSIELRCFRGTTNSDEIQEWINVLEELYKFASQPGLTPTDVIQAYRHSELEFFHNVFPKTGRRLAEGLNLVGYIERNLWYAVDIANSVNNWNSLGEKLPANKSSAKKKIKFEDNSDVLPMDVMGIYQNTPPPATEGPAMDPVLNENGIFETGGGWQSLVQQSGLNNIAQPWTIVDDGEDFDI